MTEVLSLLLVVVASNSFLRCYSYEGAMSRWLMLKPDADTPPREEEMVRKVTAKV